MKALLWKVTLLCISVTFASILIKTRNFESESHNGHHDFGGELAKVGRRLNQDN